MTPTFRFAAGFLAIAFILTALLMWWLGTSAFGERAMLAALAMWAMAGVFGFAAVTGRSPMPGDRLPND